MFNDIRQTGAELYVIVSHIFDDGVIRIFVFIEMDIHCSGGIGVVSLEAGVFHCQLDDLFAGFCAEVIFAKPADDDTAMAK